MAGLFFNSGVDEGFNRALKKMNSNMNGLSSNVDKQTSFMDKSFKSLAITAAAAFSTTKIIQFGKESIALYQQQAKAIAQVEQGLKSTSNAAGFTAEELQDVAAALQKDTLFGDEDILQNATAQLLTFTNIADKQFTRTQKAALDLATRLDGDLKSASIQLGKALNDPVANLSALSRSGIQFTQTQKDTIKALTETNRLAEAQTLILDELEKQYGGSAEAAALADGGITQLGNAIGDAQEVMGKMALEGLQPIISDLKEFFENLSEEDIRTFFANVKDGAKLIGILLVAVTAWKVSMKAMNALHKVNTILIKNNIKAQKLSALTGKQVSSANLLMAKSFKALKTAFAANPLGLLITGLTIAIPLITSFNSETDDTIKLQDQLASVSSQAQKSIAGQETTLQRLLATAEDENKSLGEREEALKKLREINPKYLGDLDLQSVKNGEARTAVDLYTKALLRNATIQAAQEKIVELRKKQIEAVTEKIGVEVSTWDELVNGFKNFGNVAGFVNDQQNTIKKNALEVSKVYQKQITVLSKLAATQQESGLEFNTPDSPNKLTITKDKGTKEEETLNYYQLLQLALKDAQLGLENLSGKTDEIDKNAVAQQKRILENINQQIYQQEIILGLKNEQEKETVKEEKAQKGSLQYLQNELAVQKELYNLATSNEKRKSALDEINLLEKKIKLLTGGNVELEKEYTELLVDYANGLDAIGGSLSTLNSELGESLQKSASLINDTASIAANIASQNYLQAAASGINLITTLVSGRGDEEDKVAELIELQNKALERQLKLINEGFGTSRLAAYNSSLQEINDSLAENTEKQKELADDGVNRKSFKLFGKKISFAFGGKSVKEHNEDLEKSNELTEQSNVLLEKKKELVNELYAELTGTTSLTITDSILEGFANGQKGAADFAQNFEDLMRNAILNTFATQFLESQFDEFYKSFGEAAKSGGGLSESEINQLNKQFNENIQTAEQGFQQFNDLFQSTFGKDLIPKEQAESVAEDVLTTDNAPLSTAGEIRQNITEETGSILAGRLGAMVLSNERLVNQGIDVLDFAVRNLQYQKAIKENTDYLPAIEENTRKISEKI